MEDYQDIEQREEAKLEEAIQLWIEMKQVDKGKGWKRLMIELPEIGRRKHIGIVWIRRIAAVVTLLLLVGGSCWLLWQQQVKEAVETVIVVQKGQPRLILNDGRQISLGLEETAEIPDTQKIRINRQDRSIVYSATNLVDSGMLAYNTLEIPRGTEYKLILADGTQVWLNAETRLRYPENFGTRERRVYLEGEAYFEVAKDANRPFRVESVTQTVEVYGTQFNVYAYSNEQQVYTTLIEGSVAVMPIATKKQIKLNPGEQAVLNSQNGCITVSDVNIEEIISWKNGMFVFDDQNLDAILKKVERWYNVEVFYKNSSAQQLVFKGNLPRYSELSDLLKIMESTGQVRFILKGNSLVVE